MPEDTTATRPQSTPSSWMDSTGGRRLPADLPAPETEQPDPMMQMTTGRMGAGSVTLVTLGIVFIVAVVFYGLNSIGTREHTAAAPPATHQAEPGAGGKSGAPTPTAPQTTGNRSG